VPRSVSGSARPSQNETVHHLPGVYARLTALEKLVDGQQDPRINHLDDDDPERQFWPRERSRLLPHLRKGEPVLVKRTHAVIVGGWPEPSGSGSSGRAALEGIHFFAGPRLSVRDISLDITGWIIAADDTITASDGRAPGPQRFWELEGIEVTGSGQPMAQYLANVAQYRAGGRNGHEVKIG
jgi:hypothetical protein